MKINLLIRDLYTGQDRDVIFGVQGNVLLSGSYIYLEDRETGRAYRVHQNEEFVRAVNAAWELLRPSVGGSER